jgi:hypothetical protein
MMRAFFPKMLGILPCLILGLIAAAQASHLRVHDDSFSPDYVLRVTAEDYEQACTERHSVLVNGSFPGPELRLQEDQTSWIRVYNDMEHSNLTMVNSYLLIPRKHSCLLTTVTALAWPHFIYCSLFRWHSSGEPMAYPSGSLLRLRNPSGGRLCRDLLLPLACWIPGRQRCRSPNCRIVWTSPI